MQRTAGPRTGAARIVERVDELFAIGRAAGANRPGLSAGEDEAFRRARGWMEVAGLEVRPDPAGNLFGRLAGTDPGMAEVWTGSHLDTPPDGGRFDGALGVAVAVEAIEAIARRGRARRTLTAVAFRLEEGSRFGLPCLGSRLLTGAADADQVRRLHDTDGMSLADAARRVGFDPSTMGPDPARLATIGTFVELHIEQGRLLRAVDPAAVVGVASEIVAHGRWRLTITGQGNHAGTTAPADRADPMIPAAAAVLAARRALSGFEGAVATVGRITPVPGGTNVIASAVSLWLDVRHADATVTAAVVDAIVADVRAEAAAEGCTVMVQRESMSDRVTFDPGLGLEISGRLGVPVIPTAAGHDAGVFAAHVPTAMLFVRNPSGVSHAPDEHADAADCVTGVQALADVLETLVGDINPAARHVGAGDE